MVNFWNTPVGQEQMNLTRSGSTSKGGKTGAENRNGAGTAGPRKCFNVSDWRYAAFAFFAAAVCGWFGFALPVAFRAACVFSFSANSCLTLGAT